MTGNCVAVAGLLVWLAASTIQSLAQPPGADTELARGIQLVQQGDYGEAIILLDTVAKRLRPQPHMRIAAAQAYLYLGIAYLAEDQETLAKASFREAVLKHPTLELNPFDVSPRVRDLFQKAKDEIAAQPAETKPPAKGKSKLPLILLGAGGAGAAAVALRANAADSSVIAQGAAAATTSSSSPTASVTAPHTGLRINCAQAITVTITVSNTLSTVLTVGSVAGTITSVCNNTTTNLPTLQVVVNSIAPSSSAVVFSGSPFAPGATAGCCRTVCSGFVCPFRTTHTVSTSGGQINAGSVDYLVEYSGCPQCPTTLAADAATCASDPVLAHPTSKGDGASKQVSGRSEH